MKPGAYHNPAFKRIAKASYKPAPGKTAATKRSKACRRSAVVGKNTQSQLKKLENIENYR